MSDVYKLVNATQLESNLTSVANAIRSKSGGSTSIAFPTGFVNAISNISVGIVPSGTLSIASNGTYDVSSFASAEVDISSSEEQTYTATVSIAGNSAVTYNSVQYTDGTFTYHADDIVTIRIQSSMACKLYVDGIVVASGLTPLVYQYTLPSNDINILINSSGEGYITFNTILITSDGHYDVKDYIRADVNVGGIEHKENEIIARTISGIYENNEATVLGFYAFASCASLTSVSFQSVANIGSYAFNYCTSLISANFPNCVAISRQAFYSCNKLSYINFPECSFIGQDAFGYCSSLTSVYFSKCTLIDYRAFGNCSNLITASFPLVSFISSSAFYNDSKLTTIACSLLTSVGGYAFAGCGLESVNFPSLTSMGGGTFASCLSLTEINFPSCTYIGPSAFENCKNISSINIPLCSYIGATAFRSAGIKNADFSKCETIGISAFYECSSLVKVSFIKCNSIGSGAFARCFSLSTVVLSNSISTQVLISNLTFISCQTLLSLYLLASTLYQLSGASTFYSTPISEYTTKTSGVYGSIFVPSSLYNSYITSTNWSVFSARFVALTDTQISNVLASGTHL